MPSTKVDPRTTSSDASSGAQAYRCYRRERDLPGLLSLWPSELKTPSGADHMRLLARLRSALRVERQRGLSGHWAYDIARHAQLLRAYRCETAAYLAATSRRARKPSEEG